MINTRALIACGVIATACYAAADIIGGLHWQGYSFRSVSISELAAISSPSRPIVVPWFFLYTLAALIFGLGVWASARTSALRVAGVLLTAIGVVDVFGILFPMHLRGVPGTYTDTMHIALTAVTVALIVATIVAGAVAIAGWFRAYSIVTLIVLIVCGGLAGLQGGALAAGEPTPTLGLLERINVHGAMLWNAVLAIVLIDARQRLAQRLQRLAAGARKRVGVDRLADRGRAYGELLGACATCHTVSSPTRLR